MGFFLRNFIFKESFEVEFLFELSYTLQIKIYSPNDVIIKEGDRGQDFYLIVAGKVNMIHR